MESNEQQTTVAAPSAVALFNAQQEAGLIQQVRNMSMGLMLQRDALSTETRLWVANELLRVATEVAPTAKEPQ